MKHKKIKNYGASREINDLLCIGLEKARATGFFVKIFGKFWEVADFKDFGANGKVGF